MSRRFHLFRDRSQPPLRTEARWLGEGRTLAGALIAVERVLFYPYDDAGLLMSNYQAGLSLPVGATDSELADGIRSVLLYQPRVIRMSSLTKESVKENWDESRRFLMRTFGVKRQREWLQDARKIGIMGIEGFVVYSPSHNLRRPTPTFEGVSDNLKVCAKLHVDEELAEGLLEANARCS